VYTVLTLWRYILLPSSGSKSKLSKQNYTAEHSDVNDADSYAYVMIPIFKGVHDNTSL
jgi:hypothetical protein